MITNNRKFDTGAMAKALEYFRQKRELSQRDMALLCDVSGTSIHRLETNQVNRIHFNTLKRIYKGLDFLNNNAGLTNHELFKQALAMPELRPTSTLTTKDVDYIREVVRQDRRSRRMGRAQYANCFKINTRLIWRLESEGFTRMAENVFEKAKTLHEAIYQAHTVKVMPPAPIDKRTSDMGLDVQWSKDPQDDPIVIVKLKLSEIKTLSSILEKVKMAVKNIRPLSLPLDTTVAEAWRGQT